MTDCTHTRRTLPVGATGLSAGVSAAADEYAGTSLGASDAIAASAVASGRLRVRSAFGA